MKFLAILFFSFLNPSINWSGDFNSAQSEAVKTHKLILVNFSGSDWCGPCIRLRKEILESPVFEKYASANLLLIRADFPRQKKNQLSKEQVKLNEALAEKYNTEGKFPYTLLVNEKGKVLKAWDGYPDESPEKFVNDISRFNDAR